MVKHASKCSISETKGHVHIHGGRQIRSKKGKLIGATIKSKPYHIKHGRVKGGHRTEVRTFPYHTKSGKLRKTPKAKTHTARRTSRHVTRRRSH